MFSEALGIFNALEVREVIIPHYLFDYNNHFRPVFNKSLSCYFTFHRQFQSSLKRGFSSVCREQGILLFNLSPDPIAPHKIKKRKLIFNGGALMIPLILFALSATSDSFIIGFNYGARNIKIPFLSNIFITLICFTGTYLAMTAGSFLSRLLPGNASDLIGACILFGLGTYMLMQSLRTHKKDLCDSETIDADHSQVIEGKESILLGALLCMNNIGIGIGASISGLSPVFTSAACALLSFFLILGGHCIGSHLTNHILKKVLELCSAGILIVLGGYEICVFF